MALSPEDVRNTMFGTTRMRTGYDMDEVDAFLDVIESDMVRRSEEVQRALEAEEAMRAQNALLNAHVRELEAEVSTLRDQLAEARSASGDDDRRHTVPLLTSTSGEDQGSPGESDETSDVADGPVSARQPGAVTSSPAEDAAVLSLAQQAADEIIRLAQTRADVIRAEVRDMLASQLALVPPREPESE
jgi:DivIVA domain-containing protein